jgi:hypothetical protein
LETAYNVAGTVRPVRTDTRGGTLGPAVIIADFSLGERRADRCRAAVADGRHSALGKADS